MFIKQCSGYELEKEKSNTSEDFFNRSEVTFLDDGEEPYEQDPIFKAGSREVFFKEIIAITCLLKNPELRHRKRVYINSEREFVLLFQGLDFSKFAELFQHIEENKGYEIRSSMEFMSA